MAEQVYYVNFMIASGPGYDQRYTRVIEAIRRCISGSTHWDVTTSFVLFQSEHNAQQSASEIARAINPARDVVVIGSPYIKVMLVLGANPDNDIYALVDFAKKA